MISASMRAQDIELMDGNDYDRAEYESTLRDIEHINGWTLALRPTTDAIVRASRLAKAAGAGNRLRVLDLGFGHGDTLRKLHLWSRRSGIELALTGVDLNPRATELAIAATPPEMDINFVTADVFDVDADKLAPDIVINSLFMHHLDDAQIVRLLGWMTAHARVAWFVNDLHRHLIPYHFIKLVTHTFGYSRLIRNDAPLSVARGFVRADWESYLEKAGIPAGAATIRWNLPFRYGIFCDTKKARATQGRV